MRVLFSLSKDRPNKSLIILGLLSLLCGCPEERNEVDAGVVQPLIDVTAIEAIDPASCQRCHQQHYQEWSGSMHAYAAEDPLFRAMNQKFLDQYGDIDPSFCVKCHAPMAVQAGLTTDGTNLDELPKAYQGVTCVFCHTTESVDGLSDNPLVLGDSRTMGGRFGEPIANTFHRSISRPFFQRSNPSSSQMCGSCHDITGVHDILLEQTYAEWSGSFYNNDIHPSGLSCNACHMRGRNDSASTTTPQLIRRVHDHRMVGLDVALTDFPERADQYAAIENALNNTLSAQLCVNEQPGGYEVRVTLDNVGAGHGFPSGATFDRRAWLEVIGREGEDIIFSRGLVAREQAANDMSVEHVLPLWDVALRRNEPTHAFWDADEVTRRAIPAPKTADPDDPRFSEHLKTATLFFPGIPPESISTVVKVRPFGLDIIEALIQDGYLPENVLTYDVPTFELGATRLIWRRADNQICTP